MRLPGGGHLAPRELARRLIHEIDSDNVLDLSAQVAYYFLFSLFPFLFVVTTLAAYLPLQQAVDRILGRLTSLLPGEAYTIVDQHLRAIVTEGKPQLLTVGLLVAIWSASRGVDSVRTALNLAYGVGESRPWWKRQILAIVMTVFGALVVLLAIAVLVAGGTVGYWAADRLGFGKAYMTTLSFVRWPLTAALVMLVAALVYYVLPDAKQEFKFITPGSVASTLLWLLATRGFGFYVGRWGEYGATYGSLGGVVILLTWFYLSVLVFLIGGELNAILEHASIEGKAPGEKKEGAGQAHDSGDKNVSEMKRMSSARSP